VRKRVKVEEETLAKAPPLATATTTVLLVEKEVVREMEKEVVREMEKVATMETAMMMTDRCTAERTNFHVYANQRLQNTVLQRKKSFP